MQGKTGPIDDKLPLQSLSRAARVGRKLLHIFFQDWIQLLEQVLPLRIEVLLHCATVTERYGAARESHRFCFVGHFGSKAVLKFLKA